MNAQAIRFEDVLVQKRELVWKEIQQYFVQPGLPKGWEIPEKYRDLVSFHWGLTTEYPRRLGKYVRPTLVLLTAEAMGASTRKALKTAAAMQISEDWILIHDDFEDNSLERRGKPTLHRMYSPELAINAGDALHVLMWKALHDNRELIGEERSRAVTEEFYRMLMRTVLGQTVEIKWTQDNKLDFTDQDWFFIADSKTAYYTIAGPMRLGALVADASQKQLDLLFEFGVYLGRSFQLRDDVLDIISDFKGLKKQLGNDIYEGKRTLLLGHLLRTASATDRKQLSGILGKSRDEKTPQEVAWVIERMHYYGSVVYAQQQAEKLAKKATQFFAEKLTFLSGEPARDALRKGIEFMVKREH